MTSPSLGGKLCLSLRYVMVPLIMGVPGWSPWPSAPSKCPIAATQQPSSEPRCHHLPESSWFPSPGHLPCSLAFSQPQGDHKDCLPLLQGLIVLIAFPTVSWMEFLSYIIPTGAGNDRIHCFPSSPASIMVTKCLRSASKEEHFQIFPLRSLSPITSSLWRGRASWWGTWWQDRAARLLEGRN